MKFNYYVLAIAILSLSACAWVEPTPQSEQVSVVKPFNVKSCKLLKTSTVSVTQKVGIITRGDDRVREELVILAKNKAGEIGGDSIVIESVADGSMKYETFKCSE